ncbi:MAG: hypothetical protein ACXVXP_05905 [Mycobacteriaceae bacterium]
MPTAPTLVASSIKTGVTQTLASDSVTVQTGDVVTVLCGDEGNSTESFNTPVTTISNSGITLLQSHPASSNCAGGAWTFTVTANGSGTVTSQCTQAGINQVIAVFVDRGGTAATAARSALSAGSGRTVAYTASQADSALHWMVLDWAAATAQTPVPTSTSHTTTTPGPAATPQSATVASIYTENVATLDDQPSTASTGYGIGGTGTGPFTIIVVEVQGAGGAPATKPFVSHPARRAPIFRASTF